MKDLNDFDKVHKHYDNFMKLFNLYKHEDILTLADFKNHQVVVDIGGGTGALAEFISYSCTTVYVLDKSNKMLSKVKTSKNVISIEGDALNTPFKDNTIDTVILSDVFHHIKEQNQLILEISRILKPGGKIVILDFNKNYLKTKLLIAFEFFIFGPLYFKTLQEVKNMLETAFSITRINDKGYYFILTGEKND